MRAKKVLLLMLLVGALAASAAAQDTPPIPRPRADNPNAAYKLDFVIGELDGGKRVNTRTYSLVVDEGTHANMHMGMRVPVQGEKGPQYMDVGLRLDARVRGRDGDNVWLSTKFEISSLVENPQGGGVGGALPLRNVEYSLGAVIALGKPTVISAGDELSSQRRFELSVTVTKLR